MARLLADENMPSDVVAALRSDGHDVAWIREVAPAADDNAVLARASAEDRLLLTLDKDFGELAFRLGSVAAPGIILLRPRLRSPGHLIKFTRAVLARDRGWRGHFAVAEEGRLRILPLPPG